MKPVKKNNHTFTLRDAADAFTKKIGTEIDENQVRILSRNIKDLRIYAIQVKEISYLCYAYSKHKYKIKKVTWEHDSKNNHTFSLFDAAHAFTEEAGTEIDENQVRILSRNIKELRIYAIQVKEISYLCYAYSKHKYKIKKVTWEPE